MSWIWTACGLFVAVGLAAAADPAPQPVADATIPAAPAVPPPTIEAGDPLLPSRAEPNCPKPLFDSMHQSEEYGFKSLFDSLNPPNRTGKHWYEKLSLRGYTQFRYGRTVGQDPNGAEPILLGDRTINGNSENFFVRRARFILFGDVSEHLYLYAQPDFASTPSGSQTSTYFGQLRDLYGDIYLTTDKVNRVRVGLSKVPYGFENMQSSQNRAPLDRTDAINTAVAPNERDLGVFYYWTPESKQDLLRDLVAGGLKGSGNFGIFGVGVYNGQGGSQFEQNLNMHTVARVTWPFRLSSGQVIEASLQGYTGTYVVEGAEINPLGGDEVMVPEGTRRSGDTRGQTDQRIAATFVYYPQPFGFQAEWNVGRGPGLNDAETAVISRPLSGGYAMAMYKHDSESNGIFIPYVRYQHYDGGYRSIANAPYGRHDQWDLGIEWHWKREIELTLEYSFVDGVSLTATDEEGVTPYQNFNGGLIRLQCQINY